MREYTVVMAEEDQPAFISSFQSAHRLFPLRCKGITRNTFRRLWLQMESLEWSNKMPLLWAVVLVNTGPIVAI